MNQFHFTFEYNDKLYCKALFCNLFEMALITTRLYFLHPCDHKTNSTVPTLFVSSLII